MTEKRHLDREKIRKAAQKARLIVAARAELAALETECVVEFGSTEQLFAAVGERIRAKKVAQVAHGNKSRELEHA